MDQRPQCKAWNFENTREKVRGNAPNLGIGKEFLNRTSRAQEIGENDK
jgi:hypothetical protein